MSFGAGWITTSRAQDIAAEAGGARSVPALAGALAWLGSGTGGILMSRIAERIGTRSTVIFGSLMIASASPFRPLDRRGAMDWPRTVHRPDRLAGINAPLYIYVSRWFDRGAARRWR